MGSFEAAKKWRGWFALSGQGIVPLLDEIPNELNADSTDNKRFTWVKCQHRKPQPGARYAVKVTSYYPGHIHAREKVYCSLHYRVEEQQGVSNAA